MFGAFSMQICKVLHHFGYIGSKCCNLVSFLNSPPGIEVKVVKDYPELATTVCFRTEAVTAVKVVGTGWWSWCSWHQTWHR